MDLKQYRPPYHDELLHGWLMALADSNYPMDPRGIHLVLDFALPFRRAPTKKDSLPRKPLRTNFIRGLDHGVRRLQKAGYSIHDPSEVITFNTASVTMGIAQDIGDQARNIHAALADVTGGPFDIPTPRLLINELRVCPCCLREVPYIRTWHNLAGVNACAVHGTKLEALTSSNFFALVHVGKTLERHADPRDIEYAKCVKYIYEHPSELNLHDIKTYLASKGISLPKPTKNAFISIVNSLLDNHIKCSDVLASRSPRPFVCKCSDYSLISQQGVLGTFRCLKCNTVWTDAVEAVRIGFACPRCSVDKPPNALLAEILQRIGDGQYRLTEPFKGVAATQDILHETCGRSISTRLGHKIWRGTTCTCEKVHTTRSLQRQVDDIASGFEVEAYDPAKGIITLRHNVCGNRMTPFWTGFKANPTCPYCKVKERELHRRDKLAAALSEEYEVIDCPNDDPVRVRHKACGKEMVGKYAPFIHGRKCPLCTPYYKNNRAEGKLPYEADLQKEMDAWFEHHPLWVAGRHRVGAHTREYYEALPKLVKKGYIYLLDRGLYSNRSDMTVYDILKWKYLMDDRGKTVGRFTDETAAFLAHETDVEPDIITLETQLLAHRSYSTAWIQGKQVKAKGI